VAPEAVSVELCPEHIADGDADAVKVTLGTTVIVIVFTMPQSLVTLYTVVTVGLTVIVFVFNPVGVQVYVVPPLAVNVTELPAHIVLEGDATSVIVGVVAGGTFIVKVTGI
jgi:hypothetical protein